jgi:hypothetical protein
MWTDKTRRRYERKSRRYQSDVTDAEWALVESFFKAARRWTGARF